MADDPISTKLAEGLDTEGLLRLKTTEIVISIYKDRNLVSIDEFCKAYDQIFKLLKNGTDRETMG
jgi:hypothetical protein